MASKNVVDWIALVLVIIGGLNWGLVAINSSWDVVAMIGGGMSGILARIVYALVGLAALWTIYYLFKK
ncbi:MAG TPA: DUF378 domain-containing protein [Candidatus Nanoarchaeia archaeon]|nr:DUF378 domain-containing protein [Candidatus Nanoarchaeia archaeon]